MSSIERSDGQKGQNFDPVDVMARFLSGKIKKEDLSGNDQAVMDFYSGVMFDDPRFETQVRKRMLELEKETNHTETDPQDIEKNNAIEIAAQIALGRIKIKDLSRDVKERVGALQKEAEENQELKLKIINRKNDIALLPVRKNEKKQRITKKKISKKKDTFYIQPGLWEVVTVEPEINYSDNGSDLEIKMDKMGKLINSRFGGIRDKELKKEVRQRKSELRKMIDLPIARRGSGHENDKFYKFLVRRIVAWDMFSVFKDYCSATTGVSEELKLRIENVKETVDILTSRESVLTQKEKFRYFDKALLEYKERWGLD